MQNKNGFKNVWKMRRLLFFNSPASLSCCLVVKHSCCLWEGLPDTGVMVWFIIPIVLGEGTTPISAPTGVPALGEPCLKNGLSRSCCSTILAARSETHRNRFPVDFSSRKINYWSCLWISRIHLHTLLFWKLRDFSILCRPVDSAPRKKNLGVEL